jgi:lipooligosaccharide transport system ATP-binding protein
VKIVEARGLVKDYNSLRAVDNVDFSIEEGECFGFLGPNGAGKTTVMRMLYCFITPTAGSINVFGRDVQSNCSGTKLRIGVMPQEENLDVELSVLENLIVYGRYFNIPKRKAKKAAVDLIRYMGLETKAHVNIRQLSGGMKRSLLLARALINNPAILILDEPTTGLDPHSRRSVWATLAELKARNTTLILTTHYMDEAEQLCDRVAIMDAGKIITVDNPARLSAIHGGNLEDVYLKLTGKCLEG